MVRIKMIRSEKGSLASDAGTVKTFAEGSVYEVDQDLADAFVVHMEAAEFTDEPVSEVLPRAPQIPNRIERDPETGFPTTTPVMDLAAMAATVADMLKAQFAADIAAIGDRLVALEARQAITPDDFNLLTDEIAKVKTVAGEALATNRQALEALRADHDALRAEFDEALEHDEAEVAASEKPAPKPKATK